MKRTRLEKRAELKNRALNNEMNMEYAIHMRADDVKVSGDHISQNARNAIDAAYKKAEDFTRNIQDGNNKTRLDPLKAPTSISDRIRMAEEKNSMEAKKL